MYESKWDLIKLSEDVDSLNVSVEVKTTSESGLFMHLQNKINKIHTKNNLRKFMTRIKVIDLTACQKLCKHRRENIYQLSGKCWLYLWGSTITLLIVFAKDIGRKSWELSDHLLCHNSSYWSFFIRTFFTHLLILLYFFVCVKRLVFNGFYQVCRKLKFIRKMTLLKKDILHFHSIVG